MKKKFFFMSLLAALVMTGCSQEDVTPGGGDEATGSGETKYMAVTITTSTPAGPMMAKNRAEGEAGEGTGSTPASDYEHGLDNESAVSTLDFYFFDANGNPAHVKSDGTNHMSATPAVASEKENENITKTLKAVLVISTQNGDAIPDQIVAVLNKENTSYGNKTLSELQEALTDGRNSTQDFVMTNSVYVSGNTIQLGTPIAGHLCSSEDAALANPVTIYVERTLAKVRLKSTIEVKKTITVGTEEIKLYNPNKTDEAGVEKPEKFDETQIYVKFLGWNATATSANNRLVKKISSSWNPGWTWYTADYHRSFWAINADDNSYNYFRFEKKNDGDDIDISPAKGLTDFDGSAYTYLKENAAVSETLTSPATPSQVIIAAQLVDENGDPVEFAEWAFQRMTVNDLKKAFASAATLYTKETSETENEDGTTTTTTYLKKITPEDIELKTATAAGYTDDNGNRRYLVYGALTETAAAKEWYLEPRLDATKIDEDKISEIFYQLGGAKVWTGGRTYYYFNIRHLAYGNTAAEFGQHGVVRNHVYDTNVTSLKGLGTPVYDPYEKIIPEKPEDDNTFIAAEIKVLSWRIVNSSYDLVW